MYATRAIQKTIAVGITIKIDRTEPIVHKFDAVINTTGDPDGNIMKSQLTTDLTIQIHCQMPMLMKILGHDYSISPLRRTYAKMQNLSGIAQRNDDLIVAPGAELLFTLIYEQTPSTNMLPEIYNVRITSLHTGETGDWCPVTTIAEGTDNENSRQMQLKAVLESHLARAFIMRGTLREPITGQDLTKLFTDTARSSITMLESNRITKEAVIRYVQ